jgi:hypothetical protein
MMAKDFTYDSTSREYTSQEKKHFAKRNAWARLKRGLEKETAELKKLEKVVGDEDDKWRKNVKWADKLEALVDDVLKAFKIDRECYNGKTFTGGMSQQLVTNIVEFMEVVKEKIGIYMTERDQEMEWAASFEDVKMKLDAFKEAFELLGVINSVLKTTAQVEQTRIDEFPLILKKFGEMFTKLRNEGGARDSVTPKLHTLLKHAHEQLVRLGNLGRFAEDPVEHLHQVIERWFRQLMSTRDKDKLMSSLMRRSFVSGSTVVQELTSAKDSAMKRKLSLKTIAAKDEKSGEKKTKREKDEKTILVKSGVRV